MQVQMIMPRASSLRVKEFVESFNKWADRFEISTPLRAAHYIGQVAHETGQLKWLEEIASGANYEGRKDLGNTQPGDGKRFKGRGYLQTTGRANYQAYASSIFCNGDLMSHPEWLAKQPGCQKSSMFFWWKNKLNQWADADDCRGVTRHINGGYNHFVERQNFTRMAKAVLCKPDTTDAEEEESV